MRLLVLICQSDSQGVCHSQWFFATSEAFFISTPPSSWSRARGAWTARTSSSTNTWWTSSGVTTWWTTSQVSLSLKMGPRPNKWLLACQRNGKIMDEHSDVYSWGGVSLIMLLCPVVINRPVGGVISVRSHSYANCTAKQEHCGQFNAD